MAFRPATDSLLAAVETLSDHTLARRADLGALLEMRDRPGAQQTLEELSFHAKFVHRAHGILTRIGRDGEGYERLAAEFGASMEKTVRLLTDFIASAPPEVRTHFAATYCAMTQEALASMLALCHDLAWYKNWLIDDAARSGGRA
jgi:hypothetical protein